MTVKATGGVWVIETPVGDSFAIVRDADKVCDWKWIASVHYDPPEDREPAESYISEEEARANAALLLAAPNMLKALRNLSMFCAGRLPISDLNCPEMKAAADAVAQAEGRPNESEG